MSRGFYRKLAISNIRKNGRTYFPYILTCIFTVSMYYIVKSLSLNPGLAQMPGAATLGFIMDMGSRIIAIFSLIFLFYTNSFLIKRRKKEFGVFNILGLEKRHLSRVLFWEMLCVAAVSLCGGLVVGIALDKVMFLLVTRMLGGTAPLGFFLSGKVMGATVSLFGVVFLLLYANMVRQVQWASPVELLKGGNTGEKEPRVKWVIALLGAVCLGAGYYMSLNLTNPIASIALFFPTVLLVIAGTYLLFTAGSIAFLKLLRKNKKYYYKTRHFTSVSGLVYRMKQNAVGLANICILSTMVLIMVSSTTSLMIGMEDIIGSRYPNDFTLYMPADRETKEQGVWEETAAGIARLQEEHKIPVTGEIQYTYLSFAAMRQGDTFELKGADPAGGDIYDLDLICNLFFVPLSDYNRITGEDRTLKKGEALFYANRNVSYESHTLEVLDRKYDLVEKLDSFLGNGVSAMDISSTYYLVVQDMEELYSLEEQQKAVYGDNSSNIRICYGFDMDGDDRARETFYGNLCQMLNREGFTGYVESRAGARADFFGVYGGLFFLGIFLGSLFLVATVLIIYYKQISEGYEDRERFVIMQKVGMSWAEVRASIRSQVLTVFFLPLLAAGVHVAVAFPLIARILLIFNLTNTGLYVVCTLMCFLVFAALYVAIYSWTARTYYRIVR